MSCFGVPAIPSAPQPAEQNPFIDAQIYSLYPVRQPSQSKNLCPIHENPQFRGRDLQNLPSVHKKPVSVDGLPKPLFLSTKSCLFVDWLIGMRLSSMKTALFVDGTLQNRFPSTNPRLFMDGPRKTACPSAKLPDLMDGDGAIQACGQHVSQAIWLVPQGVWVMLRSLTLPRLTCCRQPFRNFRHCLLVLA